MKLKFLKDSRDKNDLAIKYEKDKEYKFAIKRAKEIIKTGRAIEVVEVIEVEEGGE